MGMVYGFCPSKKLREKRKKPEKLFAYAPAGVSER
jgi:hypothetical protein